MLEHNTFPLPNIDDMIRKLDGFAYSTFLNLNRGYYHLMIHPES